MQKPKLDLERTLELDIEEPPFKTITGIDATPAINQSVFNPSLTADLRNGMKKMPDEGVKSIFSHEFGPSVLNAAEGALKNVLNVRIDAKNTGFNSLHVILLKGFSGT